MKMAKVSTDLRSEKAQKAFRETLTRARSEIHALLADSPDMPAELSEHMLDIAELIDDILEEDDPS
jgi:hypothetical protein